MPLAGITALLLEYRYIILFPLACLEGPVTSFVAGMLVAAGYFHPVITYIIFVCGDVIPDVSFYFLGRYGAKKAFVVRNVAKLGITGDRSGVVARLWHNHPFKAMMITKFSYGLSTPLLISGGLVNVPFKTFFLYSFVLALAQYAVLMTLGYYFSGWFSLVSTTLTRVGLGISAVVIVGLLYYFFTRYVRQQVRLDTLPPSDPQSQ